MERIVLKHALPYGQLLRVSVKTRHSHAETLGPAQGFYMEYSGNSHMSLGVVYQVAQASPIVRQP